MPSQCLEASGVASRVAGARSPRAGPSSSFGRAGNGGDPCRASCGAAAERRIHYGGQLLLWRSEFAHMRQARDAGCEECGSRSEMGARSGARAGCQAPSAWGALAR